MNALENLNMNNVDEGDIGYTVALLNLVDNRSPYISLYIEYIFPAHKG